MTRWYSAFDGPVAVAVDGSVDAARAVRFAVHRAREVQAEVRLVHALPSFLPVSPTAQLLAAPDLREIGMCLLNQASRDARILAPDVRVSVALQAEDMVSAFYHQTQHASCLVVGIRSRGGLHWGLGSTTALAVQGSQAPVIAVPPTWSEDKRPGPVVVAVMHPEDVEGLVGVGIEEAGLLGTHVQVLHAWRPPDMYAYAMGSRLVAERWQDETERHLAEATAGVRSEHPETRVELCARLLSPRSAIAQATNQATLVVVGRHHTRHRLLTHVGSVPSAALHRRGCPVMVVPT